MTTKKIVYAGRLERLFANLLDTLILLIPSVLIVALMSNSGANQEPVVNPLSLLVIFLVNTAYFTAFTSGKWQATPGKRLLGIHVIRTNGRPLTQSDALERFLAYVLPSLPIYTSFLPENVAPILVIWLNLMWFAPILYTPERAGIHDRLCHTRVVVGRLA